MGRPSLARQHSGTRIDAQAAAGGARPSIRVPYRRAGARECRKTGLDCAPDRPMPGPRGSRPGGSRRRPNHSLSKGAASIDTDHLAVYPLPFGESSRTTIAAISSGLPRRGLRRVANIESCTRLAVRPASPHSPSVLEQLRWPGFRPSPIWTLRARPASESRPWSWRRQAVLARQRTPLPNWCRRSLPPRAKKCGMTSCVHARYPRRLVCTLRSKTSRSIAAASVSFWIVSGDMSAALT